MGKVKNTAKIKNLQTNTSVAICIITYFNHLIYLTTLAELWQGFKEQLSFFTDFFFFSGTIEIKLISRGPYFSPKRVSFKVS